MDTTYDPRRVAYAKVRMFTDDLQRMDAPFGRGRYTDAQRATALANLEAAVAEYNAVSV